MRKSKNKNARPGVALLIAMIFVALFSALALAMLAMSSTNAQVAQSHRRANRAFESTHSGLEVMRYWLGRAYMPAAVLPGNRFANFTDFVTADMATADLHPTTTYDYQNSPIGLSLENIDIFSSSGESFSASVQKTNDLDVVQLDVTGRAGNLSRTIRVNCGFGTRAHAIFDYGIATRGRLNIFGFSNFSNN